MIKETIDALTSFHPLKKFHNLFILDKISEKKKESIRKSYGNEIDSDEDILIVLDDTLFGKADNGFTLTEKAIYYNLSDPKGGFKRYKGKIFKDFILDPYLVGLSVEAESDKSGSPKYLVFDGLRLGKFILMDKDEVTFINEFFSALEKMKQLTDKKKSVNKSPKSSSEREFIYFSNGEQFYGTTKDGIPHGFGIKYFPLNDNRIKFVGMWNNGTNQGEGILLFKDGDAYKGEFSNHNFHGKGIYTFKDGREYKGDWLNGNKCGRGIFLWPSGQKYEGEWVKDKITGKGIYHYVDGDKYEGELIDGNRHGKGKYKWSSGEEYDGEWVNHKMHGKGIKLYLNGEKYDGDWQENKRTGFGTLYDQTGNIVYQGNWNQDIFIGSYTGTLIYEYGTYSGRIDNEKKQGKGEMTYSKRKDGLLKFEGTWNNDKAVQGTYFFIGGGTITGTFSDDYTSGKGTIIRNDGVVFEGSWENLQLPGVTEKNECLFMIPDIQRILFAKEFIKEDFHGKFIFEIEQIGDTLNVKSIDDDLDKLLKDEQCDKALKIIEDVNNKIVQQDEIDVKIHAYLKMREEAIIRLKNEILHRDIMSKFGVSINPKPEIPQEEKPMDDFA